MTNSNKYPWVKAILKYPWAETQAYLDRKRNLCVREDIGNDCRCPACEVRKVEAAEYAQEAMEDR